MERFINTHPTISFLSLVIGSFIFASIMEQLI